LNKPVLQTQPPKTGQAVMKAFVYLGDNAAKTQALKVIIET